MPGTIKDYIQGYRADPTRKYGGKDRMETLPKEFDKYNMQKYIRAMKAAEPLGVRQLSSQELANMALHEGREDFGFNAIQDAVKHSRNASYVVDNLQRQGVDPDSALFAGVLYDKQKTADRLNLPFEKVWNGTKKSVDGKTGDDYVKEAKAMEYAAAHPKNTELVSFIDRAVKNQFTPQEDTLNKVRAYEESQREPFSQLAGTKFYQDLRNNVTDPNALKLINQADDVTLQQLHNNKIRDYYGISPLSTNSQFTEKDSFGMGDYVTNAHLAAELPVVKEHMNKRAQEAIKQIGKTQTPTVTMPDDFRAGGRTRLI